MNIRRLPLLGSVFLSGLLTLGACGSSSNSSGTGGTTGSLGGTTGALGGTTGSVGGHVGSTGGTTGAGGTTVTGSCTNIPSCLQAFVSCLPSGTCMSQESGSIATTGTMQVNLCYSNGVKDSATESFDATSGAVSLVAMISKGGTLCYTETFSDVGAGGADGTAVVTIKNPAGTAVATLTDSPDGTGTLVTCPGQAAVLLPDGCNMNTSVSGCTPGVCP